MSASTPPERRPPRLDHFEAEALSPVFGAAPVIVDLNSPGAQPSPAAIARDTQAIVIGVDWGARLPAVDPSPFDILLTSAADPPHPWVGAGERGLEGRLGRLAARIAQNPFAAAALCSVLRLGEGMAFGAALRLESFAYSTLLAGGEFRRWRAAQALGAKAVAPASPAVRYDREGDTVTLTLNRPETRNSTTAELRDSLCEALAAVLDDPSEPRVILKGAGKCFSVGGDLDEFGTADDLAQAHFIRTLRSPARLLHRLGERAGVRFHGACIGGGVEIGAAAARRAATPNAFFQLPEVSMGLIPGAGGTVTVTAAIGRHRTAYLAISGARIPANAALRWGLVHGVAA